MGPQAAINAVFYNQLQAIDDEAERAAKTEELRREYAEDIDILHLASELVVDAVVEPASLRGELVRRLAHAATKARELARQAQRRHAGLAGAQEVPLCSGACAGLRLRATVLARLPGRTASSP